MLDEKNARDAFKVWGTRIQFGGVPSRFHFLIRYMTLMTEGDREAAIELVKIGQQLMKPNDWEVIDEVMTVLHRDQG